MLAVDQRSREPTPSALTGIPARARLKEPYEQVMMISLSRDDDSLHETTSGLSKPSLPVSAAERSLPASSYQHKPPSPQTGSERESLENPQMMERSSSALHGPEPLLLRDASFQSAASAVAVLPRTSHASSNPENYAQVSATVANNAGKTLPEDSEPSHLLRPNGSWNVGSRSFSSESRKASIGKASLLDKSESYVGQNPERHNGGKTTPNFSRVRPSLLRRASASSTKAGRPLSKLLSRSKSIKDEDNSGHTSSSATSSTEGLPLRGSDTSIPHLPSISTKERYQASGIETPRRKDELGSLFRTLDGDYQKFASKPAASKTNIIRASLLPFLRTYADHPSWQRLRSEDLDRRISVLNKWWIGLLEMLNGKSGQSLSASDRPTFLEAVSAIMTRSEWRVSVSAVSSHTNRSRSTIMSKSSTSLDSTTSDFLAESVVSNIRNTYRQNLLAQMSFVVERMSARSTPASVVTFCGKATAYAFFYCPGVADILVRLWGLSKDSFRRVLDEYGIARNSGLSNNSETIIQLFPTHLHSLAFTSVPKLIRYLRQKPPSSLECLADWDGPWKSRWLGKETELFFCFTKHLHILVSNILPEHATQEQRISAPGALLTQTQLLIVMDNTIRGEVQEEYAEPFDGPAPVTFDDLLGPNASAEALSTRVPSANRSMAENRIIMLVREILSANSSIPENARKSFAVTVNVLLKATAKRISLYDYNACFSLCDFLEEAITILSRYYNSPDDPAAFLDWDYWLHVFQRMGESQNSMTDVRLYAFLYSMWGYLAKSPARKHDICIGWLLNEDYATRQLCHWCPMVRAYFMRLLCWRVVRFDGHASPIDLEIFKVAHQRLRDVWHHFLFLQAEASAKMIPYLSTAPVNPAPQRRLLIIRNDSGPATTSSLLSFDTMVAATVSNRSAIPGRSLEPLRQQLAKAAVDADDTISVKKRWTSLRGLNPFNSSPSPPPPASHETNEASGHQRSQPAEISSPASSGGTSPGEPGPVAHSFKFSLEWLDRRAQQPRERKLQPPNLPPPAQRYLQAEYPKPPPTQPRRLPPHLTSVGKYTGRALAEWAMLVDECRGFYERRRLEGVPDIALVETPTLGIESFRRPVG